MGWSFSTRNGRAHGAQAGAPACFRTITSAVTGLVVLTALVACRPDPDALLRKGDLAGAAAASAARGAPLDLDHPVAEILAGRARTDPAITTATLAEAVDAVRVLEQAPIIRTAPLDLSFAHLADLGAALDALAEPPALLVVGRTEGLGDKDPYVMGGALPWKGGRLVGWARTDLAGLGAKVDADPPARVVTLAMADATGVVYLGVERRDDAWWVITASDPVAGARLVLAAESVRDYGGPALRTREGGGFVRR